MQISENQPTCLVMALFDIIEYIKETKSERNVTMFITSHTDLITSKQETRTCFINFALEKNRRSKPFIESAKAFRHFASQAKKPSDLVNISEIREPLLTASGLPEKSLKYFTDEDKIIAIQEFIKSFLEPAGDEFVEEAVYRYLLIKGDTLGGNMRNTIGEFAEQKLIRSLLSVMSGMGMEYYWLSTEKDSSWQEKPIDDYEIENAMKAISWTNGKRKRTFAFNLKIPVINKNIDLCLFNCSPEQFAGGKIVNDEKRAIMFGELKGGIDPAGADGHWKTANADLEKLRTFYTSKKVNLKTSFIGVAIENNMAQEIFDQLKSEKLSIAANLTKPEQMYEFSKWVLAL